MVTNELLKRIGIVDEAKCSFSSHYQETSLHALIECVYVAIASREWEKMVKNNGPKW